MIVYVESNFVLEVALQQKETTAIEAILVLAEDRQIELAIPSFALSEPFTTLMHIQSNRQRLRNSSDLRSMLDQLQQSERSEIHRKVVSDLQSLLSNLANFAENELDLLHKMVEKILDVGQVINVDMERFRKAQDYQQTFGLKPLDSIIYASIYGNAQMRDRNEQKCFISRNSKDFSNPGILADLKTVNCVYLPSFINGLGYIRSKL